MIVNAKKCICNNFEAYVEMIAVALDETWLW
jgi:hypothetical protein